LIGSVPHSRNRYPFLLLMATMIIGAWLALWLWEQSPYGHYLNHGQLIEPGPGGHGGHAHASTTLSALVFLGGWVLMSAAMMLPTTLPLLEIFRRLTRKRQDTASLVTLVVAGYLTAWLLFGIVAHLMSWVVSAILMQLEWVRLNSWLLAVMVLGTAGVFQFTDLKYKCLDKCRSPLSFVLRHWRGGRPQQQALTLGIHNGIYCVGCCWALMLLMFIVSTGSLGWMLLLGAVMAAEKNLPNGRYLARPLGFLLLAAAALVAVQNYPALSP
jgi:predicted metal-binding membrane protein